MAKRELWSFVPKLNSEKIFFYSFLILLPTQLGKHFWPPSSYLLGIRSDYLSPTLYVTDLLLICLFVVWLFQFFFERTNNVSESRTGLLLHAPSLTWLGRRRNILFFCLSVYLFLNIIFNNIPLGLYGLWKLAECLFLGFYIAKRAAQITTLQTIILFLSIGGIFESFLAIAQFVNQGSLNGLFYLFGERNFTSQTIDIANMSVNGTLLLRPYGTFPHPNVLAGYLLTLCPLALFTLRKLLPPFSVSKKLFYAFCFLLFSGALLITYSRVAIVSWLISIILFFNFYFNKGVNKKTFTIILFGLVGLFLLFSQLQLFSRFSTLNLTDETVVQREQLLSASSQLFIFHPIIGVGLNNFLPALSHLPVFQTNYFSLQPVHNIFVLIAVETGVLGLLVFIMFLGKTIIINFKSSSFICLILILQIILTGMFDHYWLTLQQGQLLFALVIGLSWSSFFNLRFT